MATYQRERAQDLWEEIMPLLIAHKEEIALYPDIALSPDMDRYNEIEDAGRLRCYTARLGETLVGYAIFFVMQNLHYQDSLQANQDVLFVQKAHRHGRIGLGLIRFSESALKTEGVQVVYQHIKVHTPETVSLFERLGYTASDLMMAKRLDR
jgi:hypothetical protein